MSIVHILVAIVNYMKLFIGQSVSDYTNDIKQTDPNFITLIKTQSKKRS